MTTLLYVLLYAIIAAILVAILIKQSIVYIPPEYEFIIERNNKYNRTVKPPFAIVLFDPFFDRIRKEVFMRGDKIEIKDMKNYTKDKVEVKIGANIFFKVTDSKKATYSTPDYKGALTRQAKGYIRSKVGTMKLEDILLNRKELKDFVEENLKNDVGKWGLSLGGVEISDVVIPKEIQKALEDKAIAEKQKATDMLKAQAAYDVAKKNAETHKIKLEEKIHMLQELAKVNPTGDANMPMNILLGEKYLEALQSLSSSESSKFVVYPSDLQKSLKGLFTMNAMKDDKDD
jgi:regulator of protease activity HflC (stomatin/prohibitin superfamily)